MEQSEVRHLVAAFLEVELAEGFQDRIRHLEVTPDSKGPLGGMSSQVKFWYETGSELHAVIVNVYCDDRTLAHLTAELEDRLHKQEEANRLRQLLDGLD